MPINIDTDSESVEQLFVSAFYQVPAYQRPYVWKERQVSELLNDIWNAFDDEPLQAYFVGFIVVHADPGKPLFLIDGQQRMTTFLLILKELESHGIKVGKKSLNYLQRLIHDVQARDGEDVSLYRVIIDRGGTNVLADVIEGRKTSTTESRLVDARKFIRHFLDQNIGEDADRWTKFSTYFREQVKLIRMHAQSVRRALRLFETINQRGSKLNESDLVKNLLFIAAADNKLPEAKGDQFNQISLNWQEQQRELQQAGESDSLRFIRYYLMACHPRPDGRAIRKKDVYDVFSGGRPKEPFDLTSPVELSSHMRSVAGIYKSHRNGRDSTGEPHSMLVLLRHFVPHSVQHLVPLLAVNRFEKLSWFDKVACELEALVSVYAITGTPTNNLERSFASFSRDLSALSPTAEAEFMALVSKYLIEPKRELSTNFNTAFMKIALRTKGSAKQRLTNRQVKVLVGRIAYFVETNYQQDFENHKPERFVSTSSVHVDHIFCQKPKGTVLTDKDRLECNRLGNLTLLSGVMNTSAGNVPYAKKASDYYPNSGFVLTASLVKDVAFGVNPSSKFIASQLKQYSTFNLREIEQRQQMLLGVARVMWGLDPVPA